MTKIGVTAQKRQNSQLMLVWLYCTDSNSTMTEILANYLKINVVPRIQRISGVGEVMVMGNDYAMRIWLKPDVMATQYDLVPSGHHRGTGRTEDRGFYRYAGAGFGEYIPVHTEIQGPFETGDSVTW